MISSNNLNKSIIVKDLDNIIKQFELIKLYIRLLEICDKIRNWQKRTDILI